MFSEGLSVILSTGEGRLPGRRSPLDRIPLPHMNRDPLDRAPWTDTPWTETPLDRDPLPHMKRDPSDKDPLGHGPQWTKTPPHLEQRAPSPAGRCSGRYASYWKTFLS